MTWPNSPPIYVTSYVAQAATHGHNDNSRVRPATVLRPVRDQLWAEVTKHYGDKAAATFIPPSQQVAGEWLKSDEARKWVEKTMATA